MRRSLAVTPRCGRIVFGLYSGHGNTVEPHITKAVGMKRTARGDRHARYYPFLRRLRAGGRSNMYGAIPYLMARFSIDRDTAFRVVCDWVDDQAAEPATPLPAVRRSRSPARRSV